MARIKFFNKKTDKWEYADSAYGGGSGGNVVKTVNGIAPDENGNVEIAAGGLDLENLTMEVTGVNGGNQLSLSDGTTTKTALIPAVSAGVDDIQAAVDNYLDANPVEDGKDGADGKDGTNGADGVTPHIGGNGNWWIGEEDTGVIAQGKNGADGKDGADGTATDAQVNTAVSAWLDAHPEATTTVADGSVTEEKTTFFTRNLVELIGEMEVGFGGNSTAGYHKKTFAIEPGKTYVFYPGQWNSYFNADMAEITEGWTLENNILTIPADSPLRYIRPTVQDNRMTDTFPCCYEGSDNIGQITRGSSITTFNYAAERETPVLQISQSGNLIKAEECILSTGTYHSSGYIPVTPGEKYYCAPVIGMLEFYNRYKAVWRNLNYGTSSIAQTLFDLGVFSPNGGKVVTGQGGGVYTIPEWCEYVRCTTTLTNGVPDSILVKANRKVTKEQLQDNIIYSTASQDSVEAFVKSQHLSGLTLCCLGDSVTNMSGYGALVAAKYGMTNISGGTDGARYTATADYTDNIAYNKINDLDADTDVVVLMFGTNDISNSLDIGNFTDNTLYTLYGALRQTYDLLTAKFDGKRIGVVTSPQRNFNTCEYDKWKQYNDIIRKMAMLYKIPVLDGEYAGLVYGLANDYSHFTDDVHPSAAGSAAIAYNIGKFIESLPVYHRDGA